MADSYVCSGAMMVCSCGTAPAKLTVLPSRTVYLTGQPMANISDFVPNQNIPPFVLCTTCGNPAVSAANGTPQPCMPVTMDPWEKGKDDYLVKNIPALLKSSICRCKWGGVIRIVDDGQNDTGTTDLSKRETEEFEKDQVKTEGLSADEVLDGIQMSLDVAGMVPVLGAAPDLLNAAISALRGDWLDAGMSLVAAVPGVGDAVGGAKIVKNGVKIAQKTKMTKARKAVEKSGEISSERLARIGTKRMRFEYDPKCSQTLFNTASDQKQGKLLKLTEKSTVDAPKCDNLHNIEIDLNAKNNPFSMGEASPKLDKPIEKSVSPSKPKDYSADARTYADVDPHPHLGKKFDKSI